MNRKTTSTVQPVIIIRSERDILLSILCNGINVFELRSQRARVANARHRGELDIDFIGGVGPLTKEEEKRISDVIKKLKAKAKQSSTRKPTKISEA